MGRCSGSENHEVVSTLAIAILYAAGKKNKAAELGGLAAGIKSFGGLFCFLAGCVEGAEGRFDEEMAVAEELAIARVVGRNVIEACEMPLCAVVLYAERLEIVGVEGLVAMHSTQCE